MTLKDFIQKIKKITEEHGNDVEVIMADNTPVVEPVFSKRYPGIFSVVITDEESVPE